MNGKRTIRLDTQMEALLANPAERKRIRIRRRDNAEPLAPSWSGGKVKSIVPSRGKTRRRAQTCFLDCRNTLRVLGIPSPVAEYRFHATRQWRFDYAWPSRMVAVEVEGGVFTAGRHVRGPGFVNDCDKYNEAAILGWRVIRLPAHIVNKQQGQDVIRRILGLEKAGSARRGGCRDGTGSIYNNG